MYSVWTCFSCLNVAKSVCIAVGKKLSILSDIYVSINRKAIDLSIDVLF